MTAIMRLSVVCVVLLAVAVSAKSIPISEVKIIDDIHSFTQSHPKYTITPLVKDNSKIPTQMVRFSLGKRVDGDRQVAQETDTLFKIDSRHSDVRAILRYPDNGTGAILTYVEIILVNNNELGNAYLIDGGIGERKIVLAIEAKNTYFFSYQAQFFGKDK